MENEASLVLHLKSLTYKQSLYWKQHSKSHWLNNIDKNTTFSMPQALTGKKKITTSGITTRKGDQVTSPTKITNTFHR